MHEDRCGVRRPRYILRIWLWRLWGETWRLPWHTSWIRGREESVCAAVQARQVSKHSTWTYWTNCASEMCVFGVWPLVISLSWAPGSSPYQIVNTRHLNEFTKMAWDRFRHGNNNPIQNAALNVTRLKKITKTPIDTHHPPCSSPILLSLARRFEWWISPLSEFQLSEHLHQQQSSGKWPSLPRLASPQLVSIATGMVVIVPWQWRKVIEERRDQRRSHPSFVRT